MAINSCRKGKHGEREAAAYLREHGFGECRRTQQHNGAEGTSDVVASGLPNLHIEVKFGGMANDWRPGAMLLRKACQQAERDAKGMKWVVLSRATRARWWSATAEIAGMLVTVAGEDVPQFLRRLNLEGKRGDI